MLVLATGWSFRSADVFTTDVCNRYLNLYATNSCRKFMLCLFLGITYTVLNGNYLIVLKLKVYYIQHTNNWCYTLILYYLYMHVIPVCVYVGIVPAVQIVPQRIESVNGSDINMGCASPLVDRDGVMVCNNSESYLVDSCSPTIDTSTSNWASQLVTLRGNDIFEQVVLTFVFDTAVSLDRIELDMFLCPEWNIGASYIELYADVNSTLVYSNKSTRIGGFFPWSSCDSLSPATITLGDTHRSSSYHTWHIIVEADSDIEWVYVGEVRFLDGDSTPTPSMLRNGYNFCS